MSEPTETPSPTRQQLRQQVERYCWDIRRDWAFMHQPLSTGSVAARVSRSAGTGDEDSDGNHGVTRTDVIVSARADVTIILNGWCRVAIEDYNITEVIPDGTDVPSMCRFLERWAIQLAAHDAVSDMIDELKECARTVHRIAYPEKRDWMPIGKCPLYPDRDDGQRIQCTGTVKAYPPRRDEAAREQRDPRCDTCGTEAVVEWWHRAMYGDLGNNPLVTATDLIAMIAYRLQFTVTHEQIRQWKRRGKISDAGRDNKGRTLYDHEKVIDAIRADVIRQRGLAG